jgi:membrane protease YdiL (CAAX protease family)
MPSHLPRLAAVAYRVIGALLVLNVPIILIDMLALRYRIGDLGFRFAERGLWAVPLILACFFGLAYISKSGFTLGNFIQEAGSPLGAITAAIFLAATPEEFFRMTWQTRFGEATGNRAAGWFLTAILWPLLHAPNFHAGGTHWSATLITCLNMVPLGLLWGYVLHRSQSLFPTILLHCFNYSGLQNF